MDLQTEWQQCITSSKLRYSIDYILNILIAVTVNKGSAQMTVIPLDSLLSELNLSSSCSHKMYFVNGVGKGQSN